MTYNTDWLKSELSKGNHFKYLFFWGHQPARDGSITESCLSQWWPAPFVVDGNRYATAEHWMMARKALLFNDQVAYARTLKSVNPAEVKAIGRSVQNFDAASWEENKFRIVMEGNYHKFKSHNRLASYLLATGTRILAEASPVDPVWGVGLAADDEKINDLNNWNGSNLLGYALMEVRDKLIPEVPADFTRQS
jgi:ribA/ribD-fused uncharacterized protein